MPKLTTKHAQLGGGSITQPMLIGHITYLNEYKGMDDGFFPGNFKNPAEMGWCTEQFNFRPFKGRNYGFIETYKKSIKLENLGAVKGADSIPNILVVFTAPHPT